MSQQIPKNLLLDCFNSMVGITADISDDKWIDYFVDALDDENQILLQKIMLPNHNIIIGRRGTGKSCLLARAFIECLNSLKERTKQQGLQLTKGRRILPVYLNMKEIWDPTATFGDKPPNVMKIIFMSQFLSKVWISLNSNGIVKILNWHDRIRNKTSNKFEKMISKLFNPDFVPVSTGNTVIGEIETYTKNLGFELNIRKLAAQKTSEKKAESSKTTTAESMIISSISSVMNELIVLLKDYDINLCYVFFDEFSEIPDDQQHFLEVQLLSKHFIPQDSVFKAKIAAYPKEYKFISLDETRELIPIYLDFFELYGDSSKGIKESYKVAKEKAIIFTELLIKKRLNHFSKNQKLNIDLQLSDIFSNINEALEYLFLTSMNVPRNIGHILQRCVEKKNTPFSMRDLKGASIEFIEKCQSRDFIRKISQIYGGKLEENMAFWIKLISRIRKQNEGKPRAKYVPQGHFWVDSSYSIMLSVLEGSFLVFRVGLITPKIQKSIKNGALSKKYDVYAVNKAICVRENFIYELDSAVLARNRFDYSDIFLPYELICKNNHIIINEENIMELKGNRYCGICFSETGKPTLISERPINLTLLEDRPEIDKDVLNYAKENLKKAQDINAKFELLRDSYDLIVSPQEKELIEILTFEPNLKNKEIGLKMIEIINYQKVRYLIERFNYRCTNHGLPVAINTGKRSIKMINPEFTQKILVD